MEGLGTNNTSSSTAITDHDNNLTLHKVSTSVLYYVMVPVPYLCTDFDFQVPSAVLSQEGFGSDMITWCGDSKICLRRDS